MNTLHLASQVSSKEIDLSTTDTQLNTFFASFNRSKGGRKRILTLTEILHFLDLKRRYTCDTYLGLHCCLRDQGYTLPHYSNFLKTIKLTICFLRLLIKQVIALNRYCFLRQDCKIALVDSTCLPVCHIKRSSRHVTMTVYATYSKSTMGWYYGMKPHIVCDYHTREVIDYDFTCANVDDRKYLASAMQDTAKFLDSKTRFVTDKGYQAQWLQELAAQTGNYLLTGRKKSKYNTTLASNLDIYLLHIRARIESIFSNLKTNYHLTSTRSRSVLGYMFNYTLALYGVVCGKKS